MSCPDGSAAVGAAYIRRMLHVFDLDGTLLQGTTASLEIARVHGTRDELTRLEAEFAAGRLDTAGFAHRIGVLWRGLTHDTVEHAFLNSPFIGGIAKVIADIRARGERAIVITMSPEFFADRLNRFGFDDTFGSVFPALPLTGDPDPAGILTPGSKVEIADHVLDGYGLTRAQCMAYGDSTSDAPLFAALEHTVAVNATPALAAISSCQYRGDDLWDAYVALRATRDPRPS